MSFDVFRSLLAELKPHEKGYRFSRLTMRSSYYFDCFIRKAAPAALTYRRGNETAIKQH